MMGRKFEEDDWAAVYCAAKRIPRQGWSNLSLDIVYQGFGIEHKMLRYIDRPEILSACGTRRMHPAATRSVRMPPVYTNPEAAMREVLTQYGDFIEARRAAVQATAEENQAVDLRTGWLLWQTSLRQFLYFEEEMIAPDYKDYFAEWVVREPQGARKGSTNVSSP
jgi:hypothetical protein